MRNCQVVVRIYKLQGHSWSAVILLAQQELAGLQEHDGDGGGGGGGMSYDRLCNYRALDSFRRFGRTLNWKRSTLIIRVIQTAFSFVLVLG